EGFAEELLDLFANLGVEGSDGAFHGDLFGDCMGTFPALNFADGDEDGFEGVNAAALDRLDGHDGFGGDEHGIYPFVGPGGVGGFAAEGDGEEIVRGLGGAGTVADFAGFGLGGGVEAEDGEGAGIVQRAVFD